MSNVGTDRKPAIVRVQTSERAEEIMLLCQQNNIKIIVGIEPDKSEDISDLGRIGRSSYAPNLKKPVSRNGPCPCGSGRQYKRCCGK